jgi:hypothetical protein
VKVAVGLLCALLLDGCTKPKESSPASDAAYAAYKQDARERDNLGRFQFHPANGEMPALVFDTSTGCIETIEKFMLDTDKKIVWMRSVQDNVMDGAKKRCPSLDTSK